MISVSIKKQSRNMNKVIISALAALALYAPIKDTVRYIESLFQKQNIEIIDASFGAKTRWQQQTPSYVKVSQSSTPSFTNAQVIYTRLRLSNPTSQPQSYRKIWLNFEHKTGARNYTTDYTLYNIETRQRLVGQSIQLGPNSSIDVIAAYRFIPSYTQKTPLTMSVSWEGNDLIRETACAYNLQTAMTNNFHYQCRRS